MQPAPPAPLAGDRMPRKGKEAKGGGRLASRSMDLKGRSAASAVGGCVSVLFDEGGPAHVPYHGVVVCVEAARVYVVFDGYDEAEGAWVDDADEWSWLATPAAGVPPALPVAGAWRPGLAAGPIDKIFLSRTLDDGFGREVLVKWKGLAHLHSQWVPVEELEVDPTHPHLWLDTTPTYGLTPLPPMA